MSPVPRSWPRPRSSSRSAWPRRAAKFRLLKAESITPADLERQVLWQLVWDRYLAKYRTPQRRETWFQNHHRDLDGTELVVSHILLRPAAWSGRPEGDRGLGEAGRIDPRGDHLRQD